MAAGFTKQLDKLFAMILSAPDAQGDRRQFNVREVRDEIVLVTGGTENLSERRIRQLRDSRDTPANPSVDVVHLIARAFASLARKANPDGPHPTVQSLINFLNDVHDPDGEDSGEGNDFQQLLTAGDSPDSNVVTVMGRFWDLDDEARGRVEAFMADEAQQSAKRRGFLRRRGG